MRIAGLARLLDSSPEFGELIHYMEGGLLPAQVTGVSDSAGAHLVFCALERRGAPGLVVAPDGLSAKALLADLRLFYGEEAVVFFPERELIFYDIDAQDKDASAERLSALCGLVNGGAKAVVTTVNALLSFTLSKGFFEKSLAFRMGSRCNIATLAEDLADLGYVREETVEGQGQFAIRGAILDFFPPGAQNPYRVELFYDEVDSVRAFDPLTQRSLDKTEQAEATPARELLLTGEERAALSASLEKIGKGAGDPLGKQLARDGERLLQGVFFPSMDKYLPFLYPDPPTLLDYLPENGLVFFCDSSRVGESARHAGVLLGEQTASFMEKGMLPHSGREWRLPYEDAVHRLSPRLIGLAALSHAKTDYHPHGEIVLQAKEQGNVHGKMEFFLDAMRYYKRAGFGVVIFAGGEERAKNLVRTLTEEKIPAVYQEELPAPPKSKQIIVTRGELSRGFEYPALKAALMGDKEIFGHDRRSGRRAPKGAGRKIASFTDLAVGDFVVHQNHGIGQFTGIQSMTVDGAVSDYLHIRFHGNDSLYVPTNQLDLIYKYIGKDTAQVKLNRLGGAEWQKTKQKIRQSASDMARQLLELYAVRENSKGIAFSPDTEWHASFAATFPYDETDDQLRCIDEVRADMERERPMDRLLCGDVGYGKTEVALRAAFKAVNDGYQVAYLVPTTILASQHYMTFFQRMQEFPVSVELLSRFRTAKQQEDTVRRIKRGETDIVIGTHRLVQKDLAFQKLGLLIIDEEQRFGVGHKERLKEIRKHVDVLTLSATPIPRTLHMSLSGIRDMSTLSTPPKSRYPVSTYVLEHNTEVFQDAILKEIARGGQVYYLHNRVQTIDRVATQIQGFAPGLRVGVAHGKMSERELENIMQQVIAGELDVLVCTTIIETGLDIPNINTIIVEDADRMGLSQLYQLRGRVGRSSRLAYAYLAYRRDKALSETAEKRLRAIRDFTEFGSGFKIALRDLEIRGAGSVIGAEQHGHMDAVGYEMYCQLLGEAVAQLKGEELPARVQTMISLPVSAFIPKDYITGENYRVEIYKRISSIETEQDWFDVYDEIEDRYGEVPKTVANLLDISFVRSMASSVGIEEIRQNDKGVVFAYAPDVKLDLKAVTDLLKAYDGKLLFSPSVKPYLTLRCRKNGLLDNIKNLLQRYKALK